MNDPIQLLEEFYGRQDSRTSGRFDEDFREEIEPSRSEPSNLGKLLVASLPAAAAICFGFRASIPDVSTGTLTEHAAEIQVAKLTEA